MFQMGVLCNMAGRNAQSMACSCSPGPLWVKAEGIKEVFNSHEKKRRVVVQQSTVQKNRFAQLRQPGRAFVFPAKTEVLDRLFQQVQKLKVQ